MGVLLFQVLDTRLDTFMRVAHYLVRGHSGLFYFRLRVPADLRPAIGRTVIKQATGTRCPRTALAVAVMLSSAYARSFKKSCIQGW